MQSSLLHLREDFDVFYLILRMFKKKKKKAVSTDVCVEKNEFLIGE